MQNRLSLTALSLAAGASIATLAMALAPAIAPVAAPAQTLRVVELPRVVVSAAREPRVVELQRVVIVARRDAAPAVVVGSSDALAPVMARQPG